MAVEMKKVIHPAGEIIDFETVFIENPAIGSEPKAPEKVGRFERVDYQTDVYEDGRVYDKYCNVYLPACYDDDPERRFNVMYYQHGNSCDPELFTSEEAKKTLDCLFEQPGIEPCILVFTTYYFDVTKDVEKRKTDGDVPAGDGGGFGPVVIKPNFWQEVVRNIIPAVETRYRTYLEGTSNEEILATRDHRGFSGYSRGCVCTWYMLHNAFPYFRYYAPMSCMTVAGRGITEELTEETVTDYIVGPIRENPELPFFIYCTNGYPNDVARMTAQLKFLTHDPAFSYGQDPEKNNFFYSVSDFTHSDLYAPWYYYNSLQVLFR